MATYTYTVTDVAEAFDVGCSGASAGISTGGRTMQVGGSFSQTPIVLDADNSGTAAVLVYSTSGGQGEALWEAGDYDIFLTVSTGGNANTWTETWICERTAGGAFNTVASLTGQTVDLTTTGLKQMTVNRATDYTPAGTDSDLFVVMVIQSGEAHGGSSLEVQVSNLTQNTPILEADRAVNAGVGSLSIDGKQISLSENLQVAVLARFVGFTSGLAAHHEFDSVSGAGLNLSTDAQSGGFSGQIVSTSDFMTLTVPESTDKTWALVFVIKNVSSVEATRTLMSFRDSSGNVAVDVRVFNTRIGIGFGGFVPFEDNTNPLNEWITYKLFFPEREDGFVILEKDGVEVINLSGDDTLAVDPITEVRLHGYDGVFFDCFAVYNQASSVRAGPDDIRVDMFQIRTNGTTSPTEILNNGTGTAPTDAKLSGISEHPFSTGGTVYLFSDKEWAYQCDGGGDNDGPSGSGLEIGTVWGGKWMGLVNESIAGAVEEIIFGVGATVAHIDVSDIVVTSSVEYMEGGDDPSPTNARGKPMDRNNPLLPTANDFVTLGGNADATSELQFQELGFALLYEPGVASTPVTVNAGAGSLSITGQQPTVNFGFGAQAGAGSLAFTGQQPLVGFGLSVLSGVGVLGIAGQQSISGTGYSAFPGTDSITITGRIPSVDVFGSINPGTDSLTLVGQQPSVSTGQSIFAGTDNLAVNGLPQEWSSGIQSSVGGDVLALTGEQPDPNIGVTVPTGEGALTIQGREPTHTITLNVQVGIGVGTLDVLGPRPKTDPELAFEIVINPKFDPPRFELPLVLEGTYNFTVDWGDGNQDTITAWDDPAKEHEYAVDQNYTVKITGTCIGWRQTTSGTGPIQQIVRWGVLVPLSNTGNQFNNEPLTGGIPTDHGPNLDGVAILDGFFRNTGIPHGIDFTKWDFRDATSMRFMFRSCNQVPSIDFSTAENLDNITDMLQLFQDCDSMTSVDFGNHDYTSVTDMMEMFFQCDVLVNVDLTPLAGNQSTTFNSMFKSCFALETVTAPGLVGPAATNAQEMFSGCSSLISVDTTGWDTSNVGIFSTMFGGCSVWDDAPSVSVFDFSSATDLSRMFSGCNGLTTIDLANFNTVNVTTFFETFNACNSLASVTNATSLRTDSATNLAEMFLSCNSLTSLDVSSFNTSNVTLFREMFWNCSALTSLDASGFDTSQAVDMGEMFFNCRALETLDVSGWDVGNCTDFAQMFLDCVKLSTIDLSTWTTPASANQMWEMFHGCEALENLTFGNWGPTGVGCSFSRMFQDCSALVTLDLSTIDMSNVDHVSQMCERCSRLQNISLPGSATITLMSGMFRDCPALLSVDMSGWDVSGVSDMSGVFDGCVSLNSVGTTGWNTAGATNMDSMFDGCAALKSVDADNFDVSSVTSMSFMFRGVKLNTSKYDTILISWEGQVVQSGVTFDGGLSFYTGGGAAETARTNLINNSTWSITDGGVAPDIEVIPLNTTVFPLLEEPTLGTGDVEVTPGVGGISIVGQQPSTFTGTHAFVDSGVGVLSITPLKPLAGFGRETLIGLGGVSLAGVQAEVSAGASAESGFDILSLAGQSIETTAKVVMGAGELSVQGLPVSLVLDHGVEVPLGTLNIQGKVPFPEGGVFSTPGSDILRFFKKQPDLKTGSVFSVEAGALNLAGGAPGILAETPIFVGFDTLFLTGYGPDVITIADLVRFTPPERVVAVDPEDRSIMVNPDPRRVTIASENRKLEVEKELRVVAVPKREKIVLT